MALSNMTDEAALLARCVIKIKGPCFYPTWTKLVKTAALD